MVRPDRSREMLEGVREGKGPGFRERFYSVRFPKLSDDRGPQACREDGGEGYECQPDPMNSRHVDLQVDWPDCGRAGNTARDFPGPFKSAPNATGC
jgi:hypothetical protein